MPGFEPGEVGPTPAEATLEMGYGAALVWLPDCHSGDQTGSIPVYPAILPCGVIGEHI